MMRSMTILSSTVAIAMASDFAVVDSSSSSDVAAARVPQQELWYPDFASDYESGSCTTLPSPALLAFDSGAIDGSSLAHEDRESCCDAWFSEQEQCGCLGGCPKDENDAAPTLSVTVTAEPLAEEHSYWYPQFDVTYEEGKCVKAGVNTDEVHPSYFTMEGGFLHESIDSCCDHWFGYQQTKTCMNVLGEIAMQQPTASMTTRSANVTSMEEGIVEPHAGVHFQESRAAVVTEESL